MPVVIPTGVQVEINGANVGVKGPKGEMRRTFSPIHRNYDGEWSDLTSRENQTSPLNVLCMAPRVPYWQYD